MTRQLKNSEVIELAIALLSADTEEEVVSILTKAGYWTDPTAWRLFGDRDGNFSTIGNQQSRPEAALVEKIVNCVDARLMNECLRSGVDPESAKAPASIRDAVAMLIDGKKAGTATGGRIEAWTGRKQLEQARLITLAVTGKKPRQGMPSISIADAGEGQTPGHFPDTFLSIDRSNKLRIPFVQGKFNMGGTGALKFCGQHGLQLIISRRCPEILKSWRGSRTKWDSEDPRAQEWGVTVVRRERPQGGAGEVRNSVFRYLAPVGGNVLSFSADTLKIFPEGNKPYARAATHGTVLKLYEYDMKGFQSQALMKGGLLNRLEVLLPSIALPVRVHECRDYRGDEARSFENSLVGLSVRLGENRGENIEVGYPTTTSFVVREERMTAQIYAFKQDKAESYTTNEGILFIINGQTHAHIPRTFFERSRVKMSRLARSLLVTVDCTQLSVSAREDLFMNSRDRMSAGELRKEIEDELESIIRNHEGLRELQARRRSEEIATRLEESKPLEEVLDSIIKSSPTLTRLFKFGQRLSKPHRAEEAALSGGGQGADGGEGTFNPKPHPTYFRFHKMRDGERLVRNAELDRRCRIKFDTDAPNDFFERDSLPGRYVLEIVDGDIEAEELTHSCTIYNGIANWSIKLPEDRLSASDKITIQCSVFDAIRGEEPFVNIATLTLTARDERNGKKKGKREENKSGGDTGEGGSGTGGHGGTGKWQGKTDVGGLTLPPMNLVKREQWADHGFDENSACTIIEEDDGSYSFYINEDNIFLQTEMKEAKDDVALKKTKFVWGNVLVGLALIHQARSDAPRESSTDAANNGGDETVRQRVTRTTRALGPFLLPMIDYLGAITEEDVLRVARSGDEE